jgi:hypothetical protein
MRKVVTLRGVAACFVIETTSYVNVIRFAIGYVHDAVSGHQLSRLDSFEEMRDVSEILAWGW